MCLSARAYPECAHDRTQQGEAPFGRLLLGRSAPSRPRVRVHGEKQRCVIYYIYLHASLTGPARVVVYSSNARETCLRARSVRLSVQREIRKRPALLLVGHVDVDDRRLCARRDRRLPRRRYEISKRSGRNFRRSERPLLTRHSVAWLVPLPRVAFLRPGPSLSRAEESSRARARIRAVRVASSSFYPFDDLRAGEITR